MFFYIYGVSGMYGLFKTKNRKPWKNKKIMWTFLGAAGVRKVKNQGHRTSKAYEKKLTHVLALGYHIFFVIILCYYFLVTIYCKPGLMWWTSKSRPKVVCLAVWPFITLLYCVKTTQAKITKSRDKWALLKLLVCLFVVVVVDKQRQIEALKDLCIKAGLTDADIAACSATRTLRISF